MTNSPTPRLQLEGITKRYPGVVANNGVSLTVQPGEIHAVLGENGAGKSTLMKIIYGAVKPDEGSVLFNGQPAQVRNPQAARALGISMVFQHFSLFDTLTVAENVWLGLDKSLSLAEVAARIRAKGNEYGLPIDPERPVHTLSVGEMQRVEIIRALLTQPQLLILDEPTSVLTPQAVEKLFGTLSQLAREGCSILYISHKLHEIRALCTACTVLRGGQVTGVCDPREESNASLSRLMIGAEPPELEHRPLHAGAPVLQVRGLTLASDDPFGTALADVALTVRAGEVVGIAGVSGNGQGELVEALVGQRPRAGGEVRVQGESYAASRTENHRLKVRSLPEEPLRNACVGELSVAQNMALRDFDRAPLCRGGRLRFAEWRRRARDWIAEYGVKTQGENAPIRSLSGGNVQRAVLARELHGEISVLIAANPVFGLDFAAVHEIHGRLRGVRQQGGAVLLISEDLDELLELADRIVVMSEGRVSFETPAAQADRKTLGAHMGGGH